MKIINGWTVGTAEEMGRAILGVHPKEIIWEKGHITVMWAQTDWEGGCISLEDDSVAEYRHREFNEDIDVEAIAKAVDIFGFDFLEHILDNLDYREYIEKD
ncbi:MAG: hypothetical protein U9Q16_00335 [Patescibacteria group bacterium]|nr:hypothetical protein [Patescibacteria group bacterium]